MVLAPPHRSLAVVCLLTFAVGAAAGCEKKDDDEKSESSAVAVATPAAPAPPPPAPTPAPAPTPPPAAPAPTPAAAPASDVTRYPDERPLTGGANLVNDVPARKQANAQSELVQNLARGSFVTRVAQSGNWTLVSWKQTAGDKMGWVESAKAFGGDWSQGRIPQQVIDEGRRRGVLFPR